MAIKLTPQELVDEISKLPLKDLQFVTQGIRKLLDERGDNTAGAAVLPTGLPPTLSGAAKKDL